MESELGEAQIVNDELVDDVETPNIKKVNSLEEVTSIDDKVEQQKEKEGDVDEKQVTNEAGSETHINEHVTPSVTTIKSSPDIPEIPQNILQFSIESHESVLEEHDIVYALSWQHYGVKPYWRRGTIVELINTPIVWVSYEDTDIGSEWLDKDKCYGSEDVDVGIGDAVEVMLATITEPRKRNATIFHIGTSAAKVKFHGTAKMDIHLVPRSELVCVPQPWIVILPDIKESMFDVNDKVTVDAGVLQQWPGIIIDNNPRIIYQVEFETPDKNILEYVTHKSCCYSDSDLHMIYPGKVFCGLSVDVIGVDCCQRKAKITDVVLGIAKVRLHLHSNEYDTWLPVKSIKDDVDSNKFLNETNDAVTKLDEVPQQIVMEEDNDKTDSYEAFADILNELALIDDDVVETIKEISDDNDTNMSGIWIFCVNIEDEQTSTTNLMRFGVFFTQVGNEIQGESVDDIIFRGGFDQDNLLRLQSYYSGKWFNTLERWQEDDLSTMGCIVARAKDNTLVGYYRELVTVSGVPDTSWSHRGGMRRGVLRASKYKEPLTGLYNIAYHNNNWSSEKIILANIGDGEVIVDWPGCFGTIHNSSINLTSKSVVLPNITINGVSRVIVGRLVKDNRNVAAVQGVIYTIIDSVCLEAFPLTITSDMRQPVTKIAEPKSRSPVRNKQQPPQSVTSEEVSKEERNTKSSNFVKGTHLNAKFAINGNWEVKFNNENISSTSLDNNMLSVDMRPRMLHIVLNPITNHVEGQSKDNHGGDITGYLYEETWFLNLETSKGTFQLDIGVSMKEMKGLYTISLTGDIVAVSLRLLDDHTSGMYYFTENSLPFMSIILQTFSLGTIFWNGQVLPCSVDSNNTIVFVRPVPLLQNVLELFKLSITNTIDGNSVVGWRCILQPESQIERIIGYRYGTELYPSLQRPQILQTDQPMPVYLKSIIDTFFDALDKGNFTELCGIYSFAAHGIPISYMIFKSLVAKFKSDYGPLIAGTMIYKGSRSLVINKTPLLSIRHEFQVDTKIKPKTEFAVFTHPETETLLSTPIDILEEKVYNRLPVNDVCLVSLGNLKGFVKQLKAYLRSKYLRVTKANYDEFVNHPTAFGNYWVVCLTDIKTNITKLNQIVSMNSSNKIIVVISTAEENKVMYDLTMLATNVNNCNDILHLNMPIIDETIVNTPESFETEFFENLDVLHKVLNEVTYNDQTIDMSGPWTLMAGGGDMYHTGLLKLTSFLGGRLNGVCSFAIYDNVNIILDSESSFLKGFHIQLQGKFLHNGFDHILQIRGNLATSGDSFRGEMRLSKVIARETSGSVGSRIGQGLSSIPTHGWPNSSHQSVKGKRVVSVHPPATPDVVTYQMNQKGSLGGNLGRDEVFVANLHAPMHPLWRFDLNRAINIIEKCFPRATYRQKEDKVYEYLRIFYKCDFDNDRMININDLTKTLKMTRHKSTMKDRQLIISEISSASESEAIDFYEFLEFSSMVRRSRGRKYTAATRAFVSGIASGFCNVQ